MSGGRRRNQEADRLHGSVLTLITPVSMHPKPCHIMSPSSCPSAFPTMCWLIRLTLSALLPPTFSLW